jgi:hypothetical protein
MRHHAGQDLYRIRLLPLRRETRLSGTAAIEIALDLFNGQRYLRRATVDHTADRNPMALAEGRDPEQMAEGVVGHGALASLDAVNIPHDRCMFT